MFEDELYTPICNIVLNFIVNWLYFNIFLTGIKKKKSISILGEM